MITHRCKICGKDLKIEMIPVAEVIEVELCKTCFQLAEEEGRERVEEAYDDGYQIGYEEAYAEVEEDAER